MRRLVSVLLILGLLPVSAFAGGTFFFQPNTITPAAIASDPVLANMQSRSLMVSFDANEFWESACLRARLPAGNVFYQHALGTQTRPNPAFVAAFPALEFTTYVSSPRDTGAPGGTPPVILGGCETALSFGSSTSPIPGLFSVEWADPNPFLQLPGTYEIARLTWPISANLTVEELEVRFVPEPLVALPAAALALLLRRRKPLAD